MKQKASLVLMEQLVMILVVSLAAVLCLRIFAWSDWASREMQQQAEAVILCQNAAQTIKAAGSLEAGAMSLGATRQGDVWTVSDAEQICMELQKLEAPVPGLGQAEIRAVSAQTGEILFSLTTGWQEVLS